MTLYFSFINFKTFRQEFCIFLDDCHLYVIIFDGLLFNFNKRKERNIYTRVPPITPSFIYYIIWN
jgi:hypothetical protein